MPFSSSIRNIYSPLAKVTLKRLQGEKTFADHSLRSSANNHSMGFTFSMEKKVLLRIFFMTKSNTTFIEQLNGTVFSTG
jgi:hypothetical protein